MATVSHLIPSLPFANTTEFMIAEDYLREGKLDEAFAELKKVVQSNPADAKYRVFLFQMMTVLGKWESALTQLELSGELDAGNLAMVQAYREAIRCEVLRSKVMSGDRSPMIFGEPEPWIAMMLEAFKLQATGNLTQACQLRGEALEQAPAVSGTLIDADEKPVNFEWICDSDPRLGPILETLINGQYYWVPMHRIAKITIEAPTDLRDFVWSPAHFTWSNGGGTFGMIPSRYPGSESSDDAAIRLSRKTDWQCVGDEADPGQYVGLGQRMLATDVDEFALFQIRSLELDIEMETGDAEPADETD